ncbi:MAG: glycosyltransferase involved in cell wall biosynthesis [Limisphaerales bacterium]|jgi:glycosyltransferase involved in cell wall biosynthesis
MSKPLFDIVLPCYNPAPGWAERVASSYKEISGDVGFNPGLILVNDGSSSGISEADYALLLEQLPIVVILDNQVNRGKGYTLRHGVNASTATICIYTDIDFPYKKESFLEVLASLQDGADVVAGIKDASYYSHVPPARQRISKLLRKMIRSFLRMNITDTQCGLKGFNRAGREVFLKTTIDRYLFDLEFLFLASRKKALKVKTVEVSLRDNVQFSTMKRSILLTEGLNFLKVWWRSFFS